MLVCAKSPNYVREKSPKQILFLYMQAYLLSMVNRGKELDYLFVLKALNEISFGVGKKLLVEFLRGDESNKSIARNSLASKENFGVPAYDEEELNAMIDNLVLNDMIGIDFIGNKKFWKVLKVTEKGEK